jgi:micrococcal nuclease
MIEDYVRNAKLIEVVDGDTLDLNIDLGFRIWIITRVRLLGCNCPEMRKATMEAAQAAKRAVQKWFEDRKDLFTIRTHLDRRDSFGRLLVEVWDNEGKSLCQYLLDNGYAVPYVG